MNWKLGDRLAAVDDHATEAAAAREDESGGALSSQVAVAVHGVSKRYGLDHQSVLALDRIDLRIERSEIVALLGPSGCGKSTLLKVIGGLYAATTGRIELGGHEIHGPSPDVGFMFQTPVLFPWFTVLENALLPIRVRRERPKRHRERARQFIEM